MSQGSSPATRTSGLRDLWARVSGWVLGLGLIGRTTFWTIVLGTAMAGTISYLMYHAAVTALVANQSTALENEAATAAARFEARMEFARRQVGVTFATPVAQTAIIPASGDMAAASAARQRLSESFAALLYVWPEYYRVRVISLDGRRQEVVRVDRRPDGSVHVAAPEELRPAGDAPYFKPIEALAKGDIYVSPVELDDEAKPGAVVYRPTAHVGMLAYDTDGVAKAMMVLDVDAGVFFDLLRAALSPREIVYLAAEDGAYLTAPDPIKSSGFDFGRGKTLQGDIPAFAPVLEGRQPSFTGLVNLNTRTYLAHARLVRFDPDNADRHIAMAVLMPQSVLVEDARKQRDYVVFIAALMIVAGAVFAVFMARAVAAPIRRMTAAATHMADGDRRIDLGDLRDRRDETGELARAFDAMSREIATREDRLIAQARELKRSNEELGQFAYVASHDLQEPLRMVGSYLDLLRRRYADRLDGDALEFIGYAVDGATRMKRLINDLLGYSRTGNNPLKLETVDTEAIVTSIVRMLAPEIEATRAEVTLGGLPTLTADAGQIERLFKNLVENALKYRSDAAPRIRVAATRVGATWRFSVSDNGIGIDPRFKDKVFEIFKRLHGRDAYPGTGIGLAVCKLVVERHGGVIAVEPNPGGGSIFIFTIPDRRPSDADH